MDRYFVTYLHLSPKSTTAERELLPPFCITHRMSTLTEASKLLFVRVIEQTQKTWLNRINKLKYGSIFCYLLAFITEKYNSRAGIAATFLHNT